MDLLAFGDAGAQTVLLQPVDQRELAGMDRELAALRAGFDGPFCLLALPVGDWNRELSPWPAPPVFGREGFGGGGAQTLAALLELCPADGRSYIPGGYSLAGLFALWAACQSPRFAAVAAASPSLWFPGFGDYVSAHPPRCSRVYLSLGDREEQSKNPILAQVGHRVRALEAQLKARGTDCLLEWNPGNHFRDPELRSARAFAWVLNRLRQEANKQTRPSSAAEPGGIQ